MISFSFSRLRVSSLQDRVRTFPLAGKIPFFFILYKAVGGVQSGEGEPAAKQSADFTHYEVVNTGNRPKNISYPNYQQERYYCTAPFDHGN